MERKGERERGYNIRGAEREVMCGTYSGRIKTWKFLIYMTLYTHTLSCDTDHSDSVDA